MNFIKRLGVNGMMRAFTGQDKFGGNFEDYLETTQKVYETLADMCDATPEQIKKSMPVMLKRKTLKTF